MLSLWPVLSPGQHMTPGSKIPWARLLPWFPETRVESCHLWAVRTRSSDLTFLHYSRGDEAVINTTGPLENWVSEHVHDVQSLSKKATDSVLGKWWVHTPSMPPKDLSQFWIPNQWSNGQEAILRKADRFSTVYSCINKLSLSFCLSSPIFNMGMIMFLISLHSMKEYVIE